MRLKRGIYYHSFGDRIYVHNIDTQKDYILEGIALDVLEYLEHKDCSKAELINWLVELYETESHSELEKNICEFIEDLLSEKILYDAEEVERPWTREIYNEIETKDFLNIA